MKILKICLMVTLGAAIELTKPIKIAVIGDSISSGIRPNQLFNKPDSFEVFY
jgi:hypothetical protein